jgi:hypothetical protein
MAWKAQLASIQLDVYQTRAEELKAPPKKAAPPPQEEQDSIAAPQLTTYKKTPAVSQYQDDVDAHGGEHSKHVKSRLDGGRQSLAPGFNPVLHRSLYLLPVALCVQE